MKPAKTLARINRQVFGVAVPLRAQVAEFLDKTSGRLWLYDQQGTVQPDRMIAVIKHCAEKLGCQHIVIDSLMKCVRGDDDYSGQKNFVDALTACARDYNTHIHLVAHLKKGDTDERMPTRMDIKGSGSISDLVDNVLIVWRNKKKERDVENSKPVNDADPDSVLICDKQRNGDWEGRIKLWYEKASLKFTDYNRNKRGAGALL
jgi:twinkle protein